MRCAPVNLMITDGRHYAELLSRLWMGAWMEQGMEI
jgi:hypothetical protein